VKGEGARDRGEQQAQKTRAHKTEVKEKAEHRRLTRRETQTDQAAHWTRNAARDGNDGGRDAHERRKHHSQRWHTEEGQRTE